VPDEAYYWNNKHENVVAGAKMIIGSMMGKTPDDIEGNLEV
jgi:hypothetical protein